jgi:hypothetical protein
MYASTGDNAVESWLVAPNEAPLGNVFGVPRGGFLELVGRATQTMPTIQANTVSTFAPVRVWFPPGYTGTYELPMVLADVAGDGHVYLVGHEFELAGTGIAAFVSSYCQRGTSTGITFVRIDRVGPAGLTVTMLANPVYYGSLSSMSAGVYGPDLGGLTVRALTGDRL